MQSNRESGVVGGGWRQQWPPTSWWVKTRPHRLSRRTDLAAWRCVGGRVRQRRPAQTSADEGMARRRPADDGDAAWSNVPRRWPVPPPHPEGVQGRLCDAASLGTEPAPLETALPNPSPDLSSRRSAHNGNKLWLSNSVELWWHLSNHDMT